MDLLGCQGRTGTRRRKYDGSGGFSSPAAHFGSHTGNVGLILTTPGKEEGPEDEMKYEAVRGELNDDKQQTDFYKEKLKGIGDDKHDFEEVYCSREERLVCMEGSCRDCGDERVRENKKLSETCDPKKGGGGNGKKEKKGGQSGARDGLRVMPAFAMILGIVVWTLFG
jgi:hypothetical protein